MKPEANKKVRVRNRSKYNSVPRKQRKTGYKVSNPKTPLERFALGFNVILKRLKKSKGLKKDTKNEYYIDKI